jgi:hypothetical integral membrane protein (TIGR02206 family)
MVSMATAPAFHAFGTDHLAAVGLSVLLALIMVHRARQSHENCRLQERLLAVFLVALYPVQVIFLWTRGALNPGNSLPCHLCDVAALCGAVALWFRHQRFAELVWFWGLAGTLNGLITPALDEGFPSPRFLFFFGLHGAVVVCAVYLVAGLRLRPAKGAVWRAFGWLQIYTLGAGLADWLTGANYGFLREKPPQASLMDLMGPWPWYLLGLQGLALGLFGLLYLPFWCRNPTFGSKEPH